MYYNSHAHRKVHKCLNYIVNLQASKFFTLFDVSGIAGSNTFGRMP